MKTLQLHPLIALLFAFIILTGCKKDKEADPEPSTEDMLAAHSWQGDKVMALGVDASTNPLFAGRLPDIKTMVLVFKKDGTYTATYTDNGQSIPLTGEWELRNEEKAIHFDLLSSFGLEDEVGIKTLTSSSLILTTNATVPTLGQIPVEVHFVAI